VCVTFELSPSFYDTYLPLALKEKKITMAQLDDAVLQA
jgi:hypothetical protein